MTTQKTKVGKSLIEMTSSELIDEIAHLRTTLDRVVAKNKRRRKALKELNKFAMINHKVVRDVFSRNENQSQQIQSWKARAEFAEKMLSEQSHSFQKDFHAAAVHMAGLETQNEIARLKRAGVNTNLPHSYSGGQLVAEKPSFWKRLFGGRRVSRA